MRSLQLGEQEIKPNCLRSAYSMRNAEFFFSSLLAAQLLLDDDALAASRFVAVEEFR